MSKYFVFYSLLTIYSGFFSYIYLFHFTSLYLFGIINIAFLFNQFISSYLNHRHNTLIDSSISKKIILLIIGYRENIIYWQNCLQHVTQLNPQHIHHVYICIDGNDDADLYMSNHVPVILESGNIPFSVISLSHDGKRNALYKGIRYIRSQILFEWDKYLLAVTDSDTILNSDSLDSLARCLENSEKNGCVTGLLGIFNQNDSLLCRIVHYRYMYAFAVERASQSYYGAMTCCSGPISMYRLSLLDDELLETFYNQSFCTYLAETGDDRHLTNLILAKGYYSRQTCLSIAQTECPETFSRFILQQIRWTRSYYRELYWQWKSIPKQSFFFIISMIRDMFYNYFLIFVLLHILYLNPNIIHVFLFFISSCIMIFLRSLFLAIFFRSFFCFLYIAYFFVYFTLLLPIYIYCIFSFCNSQWLTSSRLEISKISISFRESYLSFLVILFWNISIFYGLYRILT